MSLVVVMSAVNLWKAEVRQINASVSPALDGVMQLWKLWKTLSAGMVSREGMNFHPLSSTENPHIFQHFFRGRNSLQIRVRIMTPLDHDNETERNSARPESLPISSRTFGG